MFALLRTEPVVFLIVTWLFAAALHWEPNGVIPVTGIYPGIDRGGCCWLQGSATFRIHPPKRADTLLVELFAPDYALGDSTSSDTVTASIDGGPPIARCCIRPGLAELSFPLGRSTDSRTAIVRIRLSQTFVPNDVLDNGDHRRLSVLLRGVAFEDSRTGARSGDVVPVEPPIVPPAVNVFTIVAGCIIAFALAWRRPIYGLNALVVSAPFAFAVPFATTTITLAKVTLIVVAIALLRHARRARAGATFWIFVAAAVAMLVSIAVSSRGVAAPDAALREGLKAVQYLASFAIAYFAFRMDPATRYVRSVFTWMVAVVSTLAVLQAVTGFPESSTTLIHGFALRRFVGPLEGPNQLAAFYGLTLPVVLALSIGRATWLERATFLTGCVASVLTLSRGGLIANALGIATVVLLRRRQPSAALLGTLAVAFIVTLAVTCSVAAGALPGAERIFGAAQETQGGLGTRTLLWHTAITLWRTDPLLGIGPGNFEVLALRVAGVHTHANSVYLNVLAEQGAFGEAVLLAFVATVSLALYRHRTMVLALGAFGATISIVFHQLVDTLWIYPKVGITWWLILAIAAASIDQQDVVDLPADVSKVDAARRSSGDVSDFQRA